MLENVPPEVMVVIALASTALFHLLWSFLSHRSLSKLAHALRQEIGSVASLQSQVRSAQERGEWFRKEIERIEAVRNQPTIAKEMALPKVSLCAQLDELEDTIREHLSVLPEGVHYTAEARLGPESNKNSVEVSGTPAQIAKSLANALPLVNVQPQPGDKGKGKDKNKDDAPLFVAIDVYAERVVYPEKKVDAPEKVVHEDLAQLVALEVELQMDAERRKLGGTSMPKTLN